jgi:catechol 2,3-dioxygenase-like lactoylglutathione lyase family enzyme
MLTIGSIVWGTTDIARAVTFWTQALDYELRGPADDDWASLQPRDGDGVNLSLKLVESAAARRHHLDLYADDQDAEVDRLLALGATPVPDWEYEDDADYVVLHDPDGSAFCIVQA